MTSTFLQHLRQDLHVRCTDDSGFSFALLLTGLASAVHIIWFVASSIAFHQRLDAASTVIVDWEPSVQMMHVRIGIALLLGVLGLLSRRIIGLFVSALALAWVTFEYVAWLLWSMRIKTNAEILRFSTTLQEISNLYGATPWNVLVFAFVIAVLVWQTWRLWKLVTSQNPDSPQT